MASKSDILVLTILVAAIAVWLYIRFKRWLYSPSKAKLPFPEASPVPQTEAVRLLEEAGYEVISGKKRVPLIVELDDEQMDPGSRLFVDYFARKDHELYVVKLSKQRQPMQWSASGIRERLMVYHHLFEETHGVLYVDMEENRVRKIKIDIGEAE